MNEQEYTPTVHDVLAWPVTVDVPTAGRCWGLGRRVSYGLARTGQFPVPILHLGKKMRVARSAILAALGLPADASAAPDNSLTTGVSMQVGGLASDSRSEAHAKAKAA